MQGYRIHAMALAECYLGAPFILFRIDDTERWFNGGDLAVPVSPGHVGCLPLYPFCRRRQQ